MTSEERLRHFADNFEQYGPDLTSWGDLRFVINALREVASELEQYQRLEHVLNELKGRCERLGHIKEEALKAWNQAIVEGIEMRESLKQTEESLSWLCGALRDQATGHPETLTMWNSTETVRRIEQARTVLKKQAEGATYSVGAMAGMAWRDIAVSAYRAYAASTGNKNYQGLPMPDWEDLTQPIQTAWEAAARQVGECTSITGDTVPPDEQTWAGWVPPHLKGKSECNFACDRKPIADGNTLGADGVIYPGDPAHCETCANRRPPLLSCYCGAMPRLRQEDDGPVAYVCPQCFFSPESFYDTEQHARREWNAWVRYPRSENDNG